MDVAIEMLEYFAREAEHELTTGIRQVGHVRRSVQQFTMKMLYES